MSRDYKCSSRNAGPAAGDESMVLTKDFSNEEAPSEVGLMRRTGWLQAGAAILLCIVGASSIIWFFAETKPADLLDALSTIPLDDILFSAALSLVAVTLLGGLDAVASLSLRPRRLPLPTAWWTGFKGFAVSNFAGFALLTGGMVRLPIYRRHAVGTAATLGMMSLSWSAFWIASVSAIASIVTFDSTWSWMFRVAGGAMIAGIVILFVWLGRDGRVLEIRRRSIALPPARLALIQSAIALAEILVSALSMYVLISSSGPDLAIFTAAYVVAVAVGLLSHVPGGLGTFEATLLALADIQPNAAFGAAIIVYRANRFILPLLLTTPSMMAAVRRS